MFKALQQKRKIDQENEITLLIVLLAFAGMIIEF